MYMQRHVKARKANCSGDSHSNLESHSSKISHFIRHPRKRQGQGSCCQVGNEKRAMLQFLPSPQTHQLFPLTAPHRDWKHFVRDLTHVCNNHKTSELDQVKKKNPTEIQPVIWPFRHPCDPEIWSRSPKLVCKAKGWPSRQSLSEQAQCQSFGHGQSHGWTNADHCRFVMRVKNKHTKHQIQFISEHTIILQQKTQSRVSDLKQEVNAYKHVNAIQKNHLRREKNSRESNHLGMLVRTF